MKMRTKSILIRSSRNSVDPFPSVASLPDDDDANGVSTTHCDTDVEIVPNTFDERDVPHKKRHCLGIIETDRGGSVEPLLNLDACIVCEISDKRVSRCAGSDCLLSFHGECLYAAESGSSSEHLANPYCSYCWLKILAVKSKTLRAKMIRAEKAVFKYLDKEIESRDEDTTLSGDENGNQKHSVSTDIVSDQELQGKKDDCSSKEEQVQVEKAFYNSGGENMPLIEDTEQPEEDQGKLEVGTDKVIEEVGASEDGERVATEIFQDTEDDETAKDQTRVSTGARKKGDVYSLLSMQESFSGKEQDQVQQNEKRRRRRRRVELNTTDSEISSKGSSNERNGEDVTEKITSSAQVSSPSGKMKNQQSTIKVVAKSKTVRGISFFNKDQRRRLYWTSEEEEMLKVGVEKFAAEANKNMPWRKILEMGEKVFQETRTPADLKDKWRNMVGARLGPKTNKTAH